MLSGPSAAQIPTAALQQRGVITLGVNNSPAVVKTNLWLHVDPPQKFHEAIWRDPGVLKLMRDKFIGSTSKDRLRVKEHGQFSILPEPLSAMPGVLGWRSNAHFQTEQFLAEDTVNWGNCKKSHLVNRLPHILNVMFPTLKIPYALGFQRVYLLGADFHMTETQPYAFAQKKHAGGVRGNNHAYRTLNYMLALLKPHFDHVGYEVYNCTPNSGLKVFPFFSLDEALYEATQHTPAILDTEGWYDLDEGRKLRRRRPRID